MSSFWRLGSIAGAMVLATVPYAVAQTEISYDVVTATSVLTPAQKLAIEEYLKSKITGLEQGSADEVVQARHKLVEPLTWAGGTEIFHLAYSSAASHHLANAVQSDRVEVRLNTMIVVSAMNDPGVVSLIQKGLADESPAVRYWAGKAVGHIGAKGRLSDDEQRLLLKTLADALLVETSERVLQRLLVGLVGLSIPEAATQLLNGLNKRVALHAANPNMPLGAALDGLRTLFVKSVQSKVNGEDIPIETTRLMALVSYRYLALSAALLDLNRPSQEAIPHYHEMIKLSDAILGWTARQMPPQGAPVPSSVKPDVASENWALIRLRAEEWKRVIETAPFNFGPIDLMVTIPD